MPNELKRRVDRLEKVNPERDEIDCIRLEFVEPSPDGPRPTGLVYEMRRQPDGSFPRHWTEVGSESDG